MTHAKKVKLARKLIGGRIGISFTAEDGSRVKMKISKFNNKIWNDRRDAIAGRVARRQKAAHKKALARAK